MRIILLLFATLFSLHGAAQDKQDKKAPEGYEIGDEARDFNLKGVSGEKISMLEDYPDAKGYIVIFHCNHCPYARANEQRIIQLHKDWAPKGYPVIAVQPNDPEQVPEDSYENMQKRAEEKDYPFPYVIDETQAVARDYGAARTPHVFLLDKKADDRLVLAYEGAIDDNTENADEVTEQYVRNALKALETGKKPERTKTKAIGCTIKWKK